MSAWREKGRAIFIPGRAVLRGRLVNLTRRFPNGSVAIPASPPHERIRCKPFLSCRGKFGALRSSGAFLRPVCTQIAPRIRPFTNNFFPFFLDFNLLPVCCFPFFFFSFIIEFGKSKVKSSYLGFRFETDVTFVPKRKFGFLPILSTKEDEWKKTFGFNLRRFKYVRVAIEKLYL